MIFFRFFVFTCTTNHHLKKCAIKRNGNTIFILAVKLTSDSNLALNRRTAGLSSSFCVGLISCQKTVSETNGALKHYNRTFNTFGDINVSAQNHNFSCPLIFR